MPDRELAFSSVDVLRTSLYKPAENRTGDHPRVPVGQRRVGAIQQSRLYPVGCSDLPRSAGRENAAVRRRYGHLLIT